MPPGYRGGAPPRKRTHPAAIIIPLVCGFLLLIVMPMGIALASLTSGASASAGGGYDYSTYEYSETEDIGDTGTGENGTDYRDTTTATGSDRSGTAASPTTSATGPEPVRKTADNPIATAAVPVPDVRCDLPEWQTDPQSSQRFFRAALPCLNEAWNSVLSQAGLPFEPPELAFPGGGSWSSPCGSVSKSENVSAFYCGSNQTIYMPFAGLQTDVYGEQPGIYLGVFAHEYGHHVQQLSGIMPAWQSEAYETGGYETPEALALSRRSELQAQCFAGQYLASAERTNSLSTQAAWNGIQDGYNRGDRGNQPRDHGRPQHYGSWMEAGYKRNNTSECNTWAANASDVS
ncbi:neutral zinc metallopeptidase [Actinopolyspora halophila]|uniref:neutral zinc metallopeptidase n=1 Tax=Actinopolyspora halophila TaxID=1850 RepID=UPI00035CF91D|nr:neutral zinc metallopeptidase [Actinopolyspora halophila]